MSQDYSIQQVPMDVILHIGKLVHSSSSISKENIISGLDGTAGKSYVQRGISLAQQMNVIQINEDNKYKGTIDYKTDFEKITVTNYPVLANKILQNFPPFSKYLDFLIMGYTHSQASNLVSGLYELDNKNSDFFFKKSGLYSKLTEEKDGQIQITQTTSPDLDYITNLKNFLNSEIEAKKLIQQLLGNGAFTYFSNKGIDFNKPAKALVEIKKDPKTSFYHIGEFLELCLYALGDEIGANVRSAHGVGQLVTELRTHNRSISNNQTSIGVGLGSLRNMSNHGPDQDTGNPWNFTEESSFGGALLGIRLLRSVYEFHFNQIQEI